MYTKRVGRSKNDDLFLKIDEGGQFGQVFKFDPQAERDFMLKNAWSWSGSS